MLSPVDRHPAASVDARATAPWARRGGRVVGIACALALAATGVAAQTQSSWALPASVDGVADTEMPAVVATGATPAVPAAVTTVEAPYSLPTSTDEGAVGRAKVITMDEALHGTTWTADTVVAGNCTPTALPGGEGLTPAAHGVMDCIAEVYPHVSTFYGVGSRSANSRSDHPSGLAIDAMIDGWDTPEGNALGWDIAHYIADNADALEVKYVIFDAQIYVPGSGWRPYHHPSGAGDPNSLHLNHVHVSVRSSTD